MPMPTGYTMHESGYWFKVADNSGPYVYDGVTMYLVSALIMGATGPVVAGVSATAANAVTTATLPAVAGKRNYITGFTITGAGSTLGNVVQATLSGLSVPDLRYTVAAPANILSPIQPINVQFDPPIPAAAVNAAITMTVPAVGLGNTAVTVDLYGYVL